MRDFILKTERLTKVFKGFTAVEAVDLHIERGHIHALIGPNGAGKTTCFNLLTKFLAPTSGRILFNGQDITAEPPNDAPRACVTPTQSTVGSYVRRSSEPFGAPATAFAPSAADEKMSVPSRPSWFLVPLGKIGAPLIVAAVVDPS